MTLTPALAPWAQHCERRRLRRPSCRLSPLPHDTQRRGIRTTPRNRVPNRAILTRCMAVSGRPTWLDRAKTPALCRIPKPKVAGSRPVVRFKKPRPARARRGRSDREGRKARHTASAHPQSVAVGDFDGNSNPDLAVDNVSVLLGDGTGSVTGPTNFDAGDGPHSVAVDVGSCPAPRESGAERVRSSAISSGERVPGLPKGPSRRGARNRREGACP
jgi:hypothetical protein